MHTNTKGVGSPTVFRRKRAEDAMEIVGVFAKLDERSGGDGADEGEEGAVRGRFFFYDVFGERRENGTKGLFHVGSKGEYSVRLAKKAHASTIEGDKERHGVDGLNDHGHDVERAKPTKERKSASKDAHSDRVGLLAETAH
jgi:hypothetical protein